MADSQNLISCRGFTDDTVRPSPGRFASGASLTPAGHLEVTHEALGRIAIRQPTGAEPGAMGVHAPPQRRVTGQTVALRMTLGTTLEALASRSAVLQQPLRLRRVERGIEASL